MLTLELPAAVAAIASSEMNRPSDLFGTRRQRGQMVSVQSSSWNWYATATAHFGSKQFKGWRVIARSQSFPSMTFWLCSWKLLLVANRVLFIWYIWYLCSNSWDCKMQRTSCCCTVQSQPVASLLTGCRQLQSPISQSSQVEMSIE